MTTTEPVRFRLHRTQREVWRHSARFKVVCSGRRWGKTRLALIWLLARALGGLPGRYWYVALTREDAKDIMWRDLKTLCDPSWLAEAPREQELSLHLVNGSEIRLWSAEKGDSLRGRPLRALVLDEYADMDRRVFHEILHPSLADYRSPALFIGTPKAFNHFYELFQFGQGLDPEWQSWQFTTLDNPTIPGLRAELESARKTMDARTFRQEYEASFEAISGRAYVGFNRAKDVRPVRLDPACPVCVSFDFNINPAVAVIGQRVKDEARIWREVFLKGMGGEATQAAAQKVRDLLASVGWTGRVRLYGDPAGTSGKTTGPSDHEMIRRMFAGAEWQIATKQPHPRDRVAAVNSRCEAMSGDRYVTVDPSCIHLIADLEQVTFKDNGELLKEPGSMLTHISDALAYFIIREWPVVLRAPISALKVPSTDSDRAPSHAMAALRAEKSHRLRQELEALRGVH